MNNTGIDPNLVNSPKASVSEKQVLYNQGEFSVAILRWNEKEAIGTRWNGHNNIGNPQSRGVPTWHILPIEIAIPYLKAEIAKWGLTTELKVRVESYILDKDTARL